MMYKTNPLLVNTRKLNKLTTFMAGFVFVSLLTVSCSRKALYEPSLRRIDSAMVIVSVYKERISSIDTHQLQKALQKWEVLSAFIQNNVSDTLTKNEAQALQQFYQSGQYLQLFLSKRKDLLERCALMQLQLKRLMETGQTESLQANQFNDNANNELDALKSTGFIIDKTLSDYPAQLQNFRNSIPGVEALVKARNRGSLPMVIKDSLPF